MAALMLALSLVPSTLALANDDPRWEGADTLYVGSVGTYTTSTDYYLAVKRGDTFTLTNDYLDLTALTVGYYQIYAFEEGSTTLYLLDPDENVIEAKEITICDLRNHEWEIESAVNGDYVLDIRWKSQNNGGQLITFRRNNGDNQHFRFVLSDESMAYYSSYDVMPLGIVCAHSGKYLDVKRASTSLSTPVIQYDYNGGSNQKWLVSVDEEGFVTFECCHSHYLLDVQGGKVRNSSRLIQYYLNGSANQKWKLNMV